MNTKLQELARIVSIKPEPETTPSLSKLIQKDNAEHTVAQYYLTPSLRSHFKRVLDGVVNRKGQGFWVQAEYGAGKTHFLGTLIDLLVWPDTWNQLKDDELRKDYEAAIAKIRLFPVAFSLRGMGQAGSEDSLMQVFEEQIRESLAEFAPEIAGKVLLASPEIAGHWYDKEASQHEKAAVASFFKTEHKCAPEDYREQHGNKKFGQELIRSKLPEGRLKGRFKDRFAFIYKQITEIGGYDGIVFVVDEFRSWQDRHTPGTAAYAEDEEILETLAYVLPVNHLNILTVIASQGDMPQKLSGGGEGDRFVPLYLLSGKDKNDFGEIVTFRCRDLLSGAKTDIKDYYDYCRNEYRFIKQFSISLEYFSAIFPFQPRCFEVLRRLTQNAEKHNLPTARSAIRMAWQVLSAKGMTKANRMLVLADLMATDELQKGLNHEHYKDAFLNLQGAVDQLPDMDAAPEEREQARKIMETLFLWVISLPDNQRDGLTAQEVAEAAWLADDAVGSTAQAEDLLGRLVQGGFPIRMEKKTKDGKEVSVFTYETTSAQANPVKYFGPLKKKAKEDAKGQDQKWLESLFWGLAEITPEAQRELGVNGGILYTFQPPDQRSFQDRQAGKPPAYQLPHRAAASTKQVHRVQYGGEVVVAERWRDEFGEEIKNADQHFRLVYLAMRPDTSDTKITGALKDARIAVCRPDRLSDDTRDSLADLIAAEQMKKNCAAPNQSTLREYADEKRRNAVRAILKCQLDEYRRGAVLTQHSYGIPALQVFTAKDREDDLAGRLLEKCYDIPLFSPKELKKDFTDADARKVYAGLFEKEPAKAEKDAVLNFGVGLELVVKSHPGDFRSDASQALAKIREHLEDRDEVPVSELKSGFCRAPHALTEAMVTLYLFSLVRGGAFEIALNPGAKVEQVNGKPLPGNRLTAHSLGLCEWNAKMDKALLGARLLVSSQKGWNEVLPFARIIDDSLKPAGTPDEEMQRNEQFLAVLGKLKAELPEVEKALLALAIKFETALPKPLQETLARLAGFCAAASYQEFDAAVRESYENKDNFAAAFTGYDNARKNRDRAIEVGDALDYLTAASDLDPALAVDRKSLLGMFKFDQFLEQPSLCGARMESFTRWKARYAHAYRKAHRAYYERLQQTAKAAEVLRPQARALARMNQIVEIGPPLAATIPVPVELDRMEKQLWICPQANEADVEGANPQCTKCHWTPEKVVPTHEVERLRNLVAMGLSDRLQRFKDTTVAGILKKAAEGGGPEGLKELLQIIQIAHADKLPGVMTDDLVAFLRKLLYDETLVNEEIALAPLAQKLGTIDENRFEDAANDFSRLLLKALMDAKAKHGASKRVRVYLKAEG